MPERMHYPAAVNGPTAVTRDGAVRAIVAGSNEAFAFILRAQGQSVDWACQYEGWIWRPATPEEVETATPVSP